MTKMTFQKKDRLTRAEAADRLADIAQALRHSGAFELERDGEKLELDVPEDVQLEFEVEIEDDEVELEVEIKWASVAPATASTRREASSRNHAPTPGAS